MYRRKPDFHFEQGELGTEWQQADSNNRTSCTRERSDLQHCLPDIEIRHRFLESNPFFAGQMSIFLIKIIRYIHFVLIYIWRFLAIYFMSVIHCTFPLCDGSNPLVPEQLKTILLY